MKREKKKEMVEKERPGKTAHEKLPGPVRVLPLDPLTNPGALAITDDWATAAAAALKQPPGAEVFVAPITSDEHPPATRYSTPFLPFLLREIATQILT